jgi:feruloyl-CoA synthase
MALEPYADHICAWLIEWADKDPQRIFLAERRNGGDWQEISYGETLSSVRSIAQSLLDRGITAERPVMLLSENSIAHALLQLAAIFIGVPSVPVSPAYSLMSQDFGKLKYVFDLVEPSVVFAASSDAFANALASLKLDGIDVINAANLEEMASTEATRNVDDALANVGPDTVARILFTSGSTGVPKGVINTHRMLCSNQQALTQVWPFIDRRPPVLVDWMPWNHTFGGNHNLCMILKNGGTLYIDGGKPAPGLVETTIRNLREVAPTLYLNVPRGYQMLVPYLEQDAEFRDHFFSNLDLIFYAAAALPQDLWERIEQLSEAALGYKVPMMSAWGLTESAPLAVGTHFPIDRAGVIGLPVPGTELKMLPNEGKLELRLRGPNIMPGYYKQDDLTREVFDEDGFFITGDAGKFADENDPSKGVIFDGRVAEDFKLLTGSWVSTGTLRTAAVSACPEVIQDAIITGHDRDEIGLLIVPNIAGICQLCGMDPNSELSEIAGHDTTVSHLRASLGTYNAANPASSRCIRRVLVLTEPLNIDAGEITDKGYVNQRAVLERRQVLVETLYGQNSNVILITQE